MEKNRAENFSTVEIDPVTHEYMILLPEYLVNDMGWYDGTCLSASPDGNDLVIETCETID